MYLRLSRRVSSPRQQPHHITITRGEEIRTFAVRPWMIGTAGAVLLLLGSGFIASTAYLVFRDDILAASLAQQARMRHAYEDRLAELRGRIDRITSRQALNQETLDAKLRSLVGRQMELDQRQALLADLGMAARRAGLDLTVTPPQPAPKPASAGAKAKPALVGASATGASTPDSTLRKTDAEVPVDAPAVQSLSAVETSLDAMEVEQIAFIDALTKGAAKKSEHIAAVLAKLGHRSIAEEARTGVGGPYVPLAAHKGKDPFIDTVSLAVNHLGALAAMRNSVRRLPLRRPLADSAITSDFGARMDPFLKRPSMHTGIDFRAATGEPIAATAPGRVVIAERHGGYGKMVEIDHGDGVTSRYAHLSRIAVTVGQTVSVGTIIGRAGTTGRSTGPHLHYEVRVDGEPVDPMRYIRAAKELRGLI